MNLEPPIAQLFKNSHDTQLNLRKVILLDSQSTMDLVCNRNLVTNIRKSESTMTVTSNGGAMQVTRKATIPGYDQEVWYDGKAITNIILLKNLSKQYLVTYRSD